MAVIVHHFYSAALTECNSMTVIAPVEKTPRESYPVLWLLPPFGGDHTAWVRHTDLERLAEKNGIMIVMPDLKLSFGVDMAHGFKYHTMLTQELPQVLQTTYPADLSKQMIAGAGTGAYAALYAAVSCPGQYQRTIAISCGSLTDEELPEALQRPFSLAFGNGDLSRFDICEQIKTGADVSGWQLYWAEKDACHTSSEKLAACLPESAATEYPGKELGWREWEAILYETL